MTTPSFYAEPGLKLIDAAWLAGLLEGEASFDVRGPGNRLRIRLAMTDRDVVERAARLLDPHPDSPTPRLSLVMEEGAKALWVTSVGGDRAAEVAKAILPFMGARRSARIAETLRLAGSKRCTVNVKALLSEMEQSE